ncbi:unnamed protein product [Symbiodinium sp. CCMP2592]|nr:unnamed protein product [Symbiodinium sp. CCMP2592]
MGQTCCGEGPHGQSIGLSNEDFINAMGSIAEDASLAGVVASLTRLAEEHPYLKPTGTEFAPHPLLYWVRRCREFALAKKTDEAQSCLDRINSSLEYELAQIRDSFRRFDHDGSGHLDTQEFKFMCAYIGWGEEEASVMDLDNDSKVTLDEFQRFVGHMGGLQQLFQQRRQRVARKQWGVEAPAIIEVGARVQAYHHTEDGQKSANLREAQVLELNVMPSNGARSSDYSSGLVFGFGEGRDARQERQVVPPNWIFSDTRDSDVVAALREVGILEEQQGFWASIFPESEMRAVQRLTSCQRAALANVRANAALNHDKALPEVRERFTRLGYGEAELQGVLGWIQDLAPMCVHIHIGTVGRFLETDEYYRSQFETGTSCGALDDKNQIRIGWETELFGGAYDEAKPFERCKYGALGVMNDYRGITSAYQYGDSYLVLKDVRLRATFAATDSGGIAGSRLAVLDKYAHVLKEYNDNELHRLIEVAMANTSLDDVPRIQPQLLRGLTADTTNEWVTMGFPDLPQKKGRYYFEIELIRGCQSPQVGLLSSRFELAPRTKGQHLYGVGDDAHGWAVDGQHSILWHDGKKLAWSRTWGQSGNGASRQLAQNVVVGIAVDIDAGKIWFGSDGDWDEEATPSFGPNLVPKGSNLYPALSFKGRAQFNFGPDYKHPAPSFKGKAFAHWPGMPDGIIRADCPIIGNSNNVNIYKEIQLHGEVNLKRNVQRLVANRKHLEVSKSDRSWAVRVDGMDDADGLVALSVKPSQAKARGAVRVLLLGLAHAHTPPVTALYLSMPIRPEPTMREADYANPLANRRGRSSATFRESDDRGSYSRSGARHGKAMYKQQGGRFEISFDATSGKWRLTADASQEDKWIAQASGDDSFEPPRYGWLVPRERQGRVPVKLFRSDQLVKSLAEKASDASEEEVFRVGESTTFLDEWTKLQTANQVQVTSEEAWAACLQAAHDEVLARLSLQHVVVVETPTHPYPARSHSWTQDVHIASASKLRVNFSSRCQTNDDCASLQVLAGGLSKSAAGVGARAHLKAITGPDQVHGTLAGQAEGGKWIVNIDKDESEIWEWLDSNQSPGRSCTAVCAMEAKVVKIKYSSGQKIGDEIAGFTFNEACPMTPFSVAGFSKPGGPAQLKGVFAGWFVDVIALIKLKKFKSLEGEGFGEAPKNLAEIAANIEGFKKRMNALLEVSDINVTFYNGLDFQLLPVCAADYKDPISDEISGFNSTGGVLKIDGFCDTGEGPAQSAGVRSGWHVSLYETFNLEENKEALGDLTPQQALEDPELLRQLSGIKLMLEPANAEPEELFTGYGDDDWTPFIVPINNAQFVFSTDGDGSDDPDMRWGVFAVVTDADKPEPAESKIEELVEAYTKASARIIGSNLAQVSIEPEDWDEDRLKALCARHGWEFEWMTEDGERRRRIEGAERARQAVTVPEKAKAAEVEKATAWWRLDSVARAFSFSEQRQLNLGYIAVSGGAGDHGEQSPC